MMKTGSKGRERINRDRRIACRMNGCWRAATVSDSHLFSTSRKNELHGQKKKEKSSQNSPPPTPPPPPPLRMHVQLFLPL